MARIDAFLKLGLAQGCSDIHLAVGIPPMLRLARRPHADQVPRPRRHRARRLRRRDPERLADASGSAAGNDIDFSYVSGDGGRFRVNVFHKATGVGATFRNIPSVVPSLDSLGLPPVLHEVLRPASRHGARHGLDGHGQVDDARGDDRSHQHDQQLEHHQPRGPDRVRAQQQAQPDHPARARHAHPELRRGRARRAARGPRRHPRRRAARRRDDQHGDDGRGNGPPRARHAAHDERREVDRPHHRRPARRPARADEELPRATACTPSSRRISSRRPTAAAAARSSRSWS